MALDVNQTAESILDVMKPILGERWEEVQSYVKQEAEKLAQTLAKIEVDKLKGAISEQQASVLFSMQKNASHAVLAAVRGIGDEAAAQALNAGLGVLKGTVNKALGFALL